MVAQELNVGVEFTGGPKLSEAKVVAMGPTIEFRPAHSWISFNSGFNYYVYKDQSLLSVPLSLKVGFGKAIRYCASFGGFTRSNGNYGYLGGISIDYQVARKVIFYLKGEFDQDYWKEEMKASPGGATQKTHNESSYWFGVGLKMNVL